MIVTAVLVAQYAGTFDVSDTTRIALRNTVPANVVPISGGRQGKDIVAADVATAGMARLHLTDHFWEYLLTYSPSITAAGVELGFAPQVLNSGSASIGWHGRFVRVTVSEGASYGVLNSAFLYAAPNTPPAGGNAATGGGTVPGGTTTPVGQTTSGATAVPTVAKPGNVTFGATNTAVSLSATVGRRAIFSLSGAYFATGGLTAAAKDILPEQYGPVAAAGLGYAVSRADALTTVVSAGETTTSGVCPLPPGQPDLLPPANPPFCVIRTPFASAQEAFRHALSSTTTLSLNVGVNVAIAQTPYIHELIIDPVFLATFTEALGARNTSALTISTGFVPTVDIRTGLPTNRAQGTVAYSELVAPRTTLTFTAAAVQSVPIPEKDPYPITSLSGGFEVQRHIDRQLDVGVGIVSLWQSQPGFGSTSIASTIGYVSVTARLPTARF